MRTVSVRIWSLAASTTPGATDNGFCLRMRRTSGAGQRRRRCALTNRSMVVSRSRTAFAGVGFRGRAGVRAAARDLVSPEQLIANHEQGEAGISERIEPG